MADKVSVWVVKPKGRPFQLQWVDPLSQKRKTRTIEAKREKDARSQALELEQQLSSGTYEAGRVTWGEFRERYDEEQLSGLAPQTARKVFGILDSVERVLGISPDSRLCDLTAERLSRYQAQLRRGIPLPKGKSQADAPDVKRAESTITGHMAHLQAALRWAERVKLLAKAPEVPKNRRAKKGRRGSMMKGRPVTGEEFDRILGKVGGVVGERAAEAWSFYLRGLWWSGLRLAESLTLSWDRRDDKVCVDFSAQRPMLRIPAECEKGNQDRLLPMAPEFARLLLTVPASERRGRVFRISGLGGDIPSDDWVSRTVTAIGKAAGVKVKDETSGKVKFASAHDFRRSFGERWAARVMPQVLQELMRHESIETTMRYYVGRNAHTAAEAIWAAAEASGSLADAGALNQALNNSRATRYHEASVIDEGQHLSARSSIG